MHEQRLKQLRQKLKTLEEDDWRYPSVDKLIGLQWCYVNDNFILICNQLKP